jgi:hypothetical protein
LSLIDDTPPTINGKPIDVTGPPQDQEHAGRGGVGETGVILGRA